MLLQNTETFPSAAFPDGETRYMGLGVRNAVHNIETKIADAIMNMNALNQIEVNVFLGCSRFIRTVWNSVPFACNIFASAAFRFSRKMIHAVGLII